MDIDVVRLELADDEISEAWERAGLEPGWDALLRGAGACYWPGDDPYWQVSVSMAEFVREEPLQSEMSTAVQGALMIVPGVTDAAREDTETWVVWGTPSGEQLVRAVAAAVDPLVLRVSQIVDQWLTEAAEAEGARRRSLPAQWQAMQQKAPRKWRVWILGLVMSLASLVVLVSGLGDSDPSAIALGTAGLLFFGGGTAYSLFLRRRGSQASREKATGQ
jgi:hypothetical protein